ncbi:cip1-interacting zinc finger protein isoform X2 [Podarcis lilfordi]|uniref:Cip1-interacting zinc finger protein isoform X2 n=1 Tax=Podarcis lilfordi TaxID=74358 RepID=A0AA35PMJ0_9SAUR|nr:cip1-interacting zinc finger protein isoform X2 [Podarcis lilfordi]
MFNQQQQQLQQQLLQLQHLLQHQPQHQPQQQQASRCVIPSQQQQQQMLNLRATSQASLLNANPMLQRALLIQQMQGNLRGFNMAAAPVLQQFFPQATRHSLLGPPPVGVSLKPTRLAFPGGLPFQRQNQTFRKDFSRTSERKREVDSATSSSQGQGADESLPALDMPIIKEACEQPNSPPPETLAESSSADEPAAKRLRREAGDTIPEEAVCLQQVEESNTESHLEEAGNGNENLAADTSKEKNISGELNISEVVSSAGSLKVTIQQSSENRAISTTALKPAFWTSEMGTAGGSPEATLKFYCYICKTNCYNQQNFQAHMAGAQHQQRLREIQHMSNICLVSLLPVVKEQKPLAEKDGESQQRWCNTCQIHFTGDLIKHRRTQEHKLAKRSLRPFCMACSRHFKTPRKFVEHMKSPEHKQKAKEVKLGEKEQAGPEDSEELITVDAVGCFEDDEEEEDEEEEEEEEEEEQQQGNAGEEGASGQLDKEESLIKQVPRCYCFPPNQNMKSWWSSKNGNSICADPMREPHSTVMPSNISRALAALSPVFKPGRVQRSLVVKSHRTGCPGLSISALGIHSCFPPRNGSMEMGEGLPQLCANCRLAKCGGKLHGEVFPVSPQSPPTSASSQCDLPAEYVEPQQSLEISCSQRNSFFQSPQLRGKTDLPQDIVLLVSEVLPLTLTDSDGCNSGCVIFLVQTCKNPEDPCGSVLCNHVLSGEGRKSTQGTRSMRGQAEWGGGRDREPACFKRANQTGAAYTLSFLMRCTIQPIVHITPTRESEAGRQVEREKWRLEWIPAVPDGILSVWLDDSWRGGFLPTPVLTVVFTVNTLPYHEIDKEFQNSSDFSQLTKQLLFCRDYVWGTAPKAKIAHSQSTLGAMPGFLCRLCHKFCHSDSAAQLAHCKSLTHFENLQRYKAMRLQPATAFVDKSNNPQQELSGLQTQTPTPPAPAAAPALAAAAPAAAAVIDKMDCKTEASSVGKQITVLMEACQSSGEEASAAEQSHNLNR